MYVIYTYFFSYYLVPFPFHSVLSILPIPSLFLRKIPFFDISVQILCGIYNSVSYTINCLIFCPPCFFPCRCRTALFCNGVLFSSSSSFVFFFTTLLGEWFLGHKKKDRKAVLSLFPYSMIPVTTPAPTVLPPSRIANRNPSSIAICVISLIVICTLSPGITISTPSGSSMVPVTSVVRK